MSTMTEAVVTLDAKYRANGYIPLKIIVIKQGVDSGAPTIIVDAHPTRMKPFANEAAGVAFLPECGLGVGWDGHRVVLRYREQVVGDSGPIA